MTKATSAETTGNIHTSKPVLFFTLANEEVCCKILTELENLFLNKEIENLVPECLKFESKEKIREYFEEKGIHTHHAVGICADGFISQCFSPMCRGGKNSRYMPKWNPAFWGVRVKKNLPEERIRSAALQIYADFWKFPDPERPRVLPWGEQATVPQSGKYRRNQREQRIKNGLAKRRHAILGW